MRAVLVEKLDGPSALVVAEVPDPVPSPDQVLVEVHAAGVSFPDVLLCSGLYQQRPPLPFVLGQQAAGIVRSAPPDAAVKPGDRVAFLPAAGAFAELAVAPVPAVLPIPDRLPFDAAATMPMNTLTAHYAFAERARLRAGETVLVHGAGGGLGSIAVQFARALGARVIAVVSNAQKGDLAIQAGAHDVVAADGFLASVRELTGGRGVDVVFDVVGGDRVTDSLRALSTEGRLLVIGFTAGDIPSVPLNRVLLANIDIIGIHWGAVVTSRPEYIQQQWTDVFPMLEAGRLEPVVGATFALDDAAAALTSLATRAAVGNVVLNVRPNRYP